MSFLVFALFALALMAWLASGPMRTRWRRQRLRAQPFPAAWRDILRRRMPYFQGMPADLQLQLKRHIQVFLAEKEFIGCAGLEVDDEMRVTIAAQACLLLLNRRHDYYPQLRQILIYPGAFVVEHARPDAAGVLQSQRQVLSGESWSNGQVILSWHDTLEDAAAPFDGRNVVIHEFAHQLDQEKGEATGVPDLGRRADYARWSRVFAEAFAQLQQEAHWQVQGLFNHYGATNPAEFFAVASEVFFEQPQALHQHSPALYAELSTYYRVNPLSW